MSVDQSAQTMAAMFLYIDDFVISIVMGSFDNGLCQRVSTEAFESCGMLEYLLFAESWSSNGLDNTELSAGQCTGLVKNDFTYTGNGIQVVTAFEEDTVA